MECIYRGDWADVSELMLSSAAKLAAASATLDSTPLLARAALVRAAQPRG